MPTTTNTTFDGATGAVLGVETIELPDPPAIDLPTLAARVTSLSSAVDDLIVQSLGAA